MSKSRHEAENLAKAICGCSDMSQHRVDTKLLIEYAKAAALAEREQVVAWLRKVDWCSESKDHADAFADAIERGEHTEPSA